jgi:dipeptidase E
MILLLTSSGLDAPELIDAADRLLTRRTGSGARRALVVAHDRLPENKPYLDEVRDQLERIGVGDTVEVFLVETASLPGPGEFDLVYVCGGNTFNILNEMRRTGADAVVSAEARRGALYVGVSAGSIIAGPDIAIAGWGSAGDSNDTGMTDTRGLGLVDILTYPHFEDRLAHEVETFRDRTRYPIEPIRDGQALLVESGRISRVGL